MPVLEVNGARLAYDEAGAGPAIVFLHAGVADRSMWDPQFAAFAGSFRCVRYDFRGFGGPARAEGTVAGAIRERVRAMNVAQGRREAEWMKAHESFPQPRRLDPPAIERLRSVRAPTLVVVGADDVPFIVETCRMVAERIVEARLVVIDDAAHLVGLERTAPFNQALESFLARR